MAISVPPAGLLAPIPHIVAAWHIEFEVLLEIERHAVHHSPDPFSDCFRLRARIGQTRVRDAFTVLNVRILFLEKLMASNHLVELALCMDQWNQLRILLPRIHIEVVIGLGHP